jgi:hypothetical protein
VVNSHPLCRLSYRGILRCLRFKAKGWREKP